METKQNPPPGGDGKFGFATDVAFVEPQPANNSNKNVLAIVGTIVVCLVLIVVVAIFALGALGRTVSAEFSQIDQESGLGAPAAIALADERFVASNGTYEIQLGASWQIMAPGEAPAGTEGWSVIENDTPVGAVFVTSGPSVAQSYDDVLASTIAGLRDALPEDAEIDGTIRDIDGEQVATVSTTFRDENGIDVATYQVLRIGNGTVAVATLSGPLDGFDALRERLEPALHTLNVLG